MKIPTLINRIFSALRSGWGLRLLGLFFAAAAAAQNPNSIIYSKHNLSVSGPGDIRAATESDICIFCHAPHHATSDGPLWNHQMSVATYTPYYSSTLKAAVGQPTGASKLCLSCHDGTVALGMVNSRSAAIAMQPGANTIPVGRASRFGTDLSAHHPVSFTYDIALATANGELRDPGRLAQEVRLDRGGQMQCTSCHDAHNNQYGAFLVKNNTASALCLDCHAPNYWSTSVHAASTATWNGSGQNPWPHTSQTTVAANACENCHSPHDAQFPRRLLNFTTEEENCYSCHNGNVAAKNLTAEFNKVSVHPITQNSSIHDPAEDIINSPRHVVCVDCHNPHATRSTTAIAPAANGALADVRGVNVAGAEVRELHYEYELCFRCHGDSTDRGQARVQRQFVQTNTRQEFNPGNASFHPVEGMGKSTVVPSLILPWRVSSVMYCTDCHNNDQGPNTPGGTGPNGPHGSSFIPLLERNLVLTDGWNEDTSIYALCYKCHDRNSILRNDSFQAVNSLGQERGHRYHIVDQKTACTTCHDSHGVATQSKLINFNTIYVTPSNGVILYTSSGGGHGTCTLTCHGKEHNATAYP